MPRRQRGTVGFRNGSWFIYYRTPSGKQVYKRGFRTEAAAIARLNEIMSEIYRGEYVTRRTSPLLTLQKLTCPNV